MILLISLGTPMKICSAPLYHIEKMEFVPPIRTKTYITLIGLNLKTIPRNLFTMKSELQTYLNLRTVV
jgi:hypothetical protein